MEDLSIYSAAEDPTALTETVSSQLSETDIEVCVRIRCLPIAPTPNQRTLPGSQNHPRSTNARTKTPNWKDTPSSSKSKGGALKDAYAWKVVDQDTVRQTEEYSLSRGRRSSYTVDHVYGPNASTQKLYHHSVKPAVEGSLQGHHVSVFAYGMTSTGKTYTMSGTKASPGVIGLAVRDLFQYIQRGGEGAHREYLIRVSYLEVYNEQIIDLLNDDGGGQNSSARSRVLLVASDTEGTAVKGCQEEVVASPKEALQLLRRGESRRQVVSTNGNKRSNRSHTIVRFLVESYSPKEGSTRVSSLNFVDLAGYESIRSTGVTGKRGKEGQFINKSLSALGQVIHKLPSKSQAHLPYRNSKLTRVLQPALSGNARIVLICNISPRADQIEESHNTLKFAIRSKRIQQRAVVDRVPEKSTSVLQSYREEIEELKQQLVNSSAPQAFQEVDESTRVEDVQDLEGAIQQMERFILKTKRVEDTNTGESTIGELLNRSLEGYIAKYESKTSADDHDDLKGGMHRDVSGRFWGQSSSVQQMTPSTRTMSPGGSQGVTQPVPKGLQATGDRRHGYATPPTSPDQSPIGLATQTSEDMRSMFSVTIPSALKPKIFGQSSLSGASPPAAKQEKGKPVDPRQMFQSSADDSTIETVTSHTREVEKTSTNAFLQAQLQEKDQLKKEVEDLRERLRLAAAQAESTELKRLAREASSLRALISNLQAVRSQEKEEYEKELKMKDDVIRGCSRQIDMLEQRQTELETETCILQKLVMEKDLQTARLEKRLENSDNQGTPENKEEDYTFLPFHQLWMS